MPEPDALRAWKTQREHIRMYNAGLRGSASSQGMRKDRRKGIEGFGGVEIDRPTDRPRQRPNNLTYPPSMQPTFFIWVNQAFLFGFPEPILSGILFISKKIRDRCALSALNVNFGNIGNILSSLKLLFQAKEQYVNNTLHCYLICNEKNFLLSSENLTLMFLFCKFT